MSFSSTICYQPLTLNSVGSGLESKGTRKEKEFREQERNVWAGSDLNVYSDWRKLLMLTLSSNSVVLNCLEIHSHALSQDISHIHSLKIEDFSLLQDS